MSERADNLASYLERFGMPTVLLALVCYLGWVQIVTPLAEEYVQLLNSVRQTNSKLTAELIDLDNDIRSIGVSNQKRMEDANVTLQNIQSAIMEINLRLENE